MGLIAWLFGDRKSVEDRMREFDGDVVTQCIEENLSFPEAVDLWSRGWTICRPHWVAKDIRGDEDMDNAMLCPEDLLANDWVAYYLEDEVDEEEETE